MSQPFSQTPSSAQLNLNPTVKSNAKSQPLLPLSFPLHGSRLIEASAGTGKTWTIAALYLRLVLGPAPVSISMESEIYDASDNPVNNPASNDFFRPLLPSEILVMTFTRAATKELSNRIRERLLEAAQCFRGAQPHPKDQYLQALIAQYAAGSAREQAAYRLMMAAESMDDAAVFTIDAWCQRMLREHAFDSGSLFNEELVSDQTSLFEFAVRDYWRGQVYLLGQDALSMFTSCWKDVFALEKEVSKLLTHVKRLDKPETASLQSLITDFSAQQQAMSASIKQGWVERVQQMDDWVKAQREDNPKCFNGTKFKPAMSDKWFDLLHTWASSPDLIKPDEKALEKAWYRLSPAGLKDACAKGFNPEIPAVFADIEPLKAQLDRLENIKSLLSCHAVHAIAERIEHLKQSARQFGFEDMLQRLKQALLGDNGAALRKRIVQQYPVALIDEFQDTSPDQYAIFDALYEVAANQSELALLLIGDPKQSIYGFRGADIHSYLAARKATEGRHYLLGTNFRSTHDLVQAVNTVFQYAEGIAADPAAGVHETAGFAGGAFKFRQPDGSNPVPFEAVNAKGRAERLVRGYAAESASKVTESTATIDIEALHFCCSENAGLNKENYLEFFAEQSAEQIVSLLNDPSVGFLTELAADSDQSQPADKFVRLKAADIAILVRDRQEAAAIRRALQKRQLPSVYLSDKDSVIGSEEAHDVLRWLAAIAQPLDSKLGRAAFATRMAGLPVSRLIQLATEDRAWEESLEQLKALHFVWQRQGVLAMLRKLIHELGLPAKLLARTGGERSLTNLLHLAELLQSASEQLDGEQSLIRWLAEQIENESGAGDERILRLESDAELIKVCTIHKSKGLEYPLVFIPFAVSAKKVTRVKRSFCEYADASGEKVIDFSLSDEVLQKVDAARIEEDLRLLYVALTRARHALWLGVASLKDKIEESALGYLLAGGAALPAARLCDTLKQLAAYSKAISVAVVTENPQLSRYTGSEQAAPLIDLPAYSAKFENDWVVGSFSALTRAMQPGFSGRMLENASESLIETDAESVTEAFPDVSVSFSHPFQPHLEDLLKAEEQDAMLQTHEISQIRPQSSSGLPEIADSAWHRFPRGTRPGQFLHTQLEWLAVEGFAQTEHEHFSERFQSRCERAGWANRQQDAESWIRQIVQTPILPISKTLGQLSNCLPEMEFWFPSEQLRTAELDRLCQQHLLAGSPRAVLPERQMHGLFMGFADLVFESEGKYWVLDYKSNFLGPDDASYHASALQACMAEHRYDIQGAIYLLALHRLLKSRLGNQYQPETHLGGAIFFFLRGIEHSDTHGCYHLNADAALLHAFDGLFA